MPHPSRRQLISWLTATAAASVVPGDPRSEANAESPEINALNDSLSIVSKHRIVYSAPPAHIPKSVSVDAPFLGNGDLLAAFAGEPHLLQFWLTTNDFWELRPWGGPRPLGRIVLEIPALKNASYHVEQDLTQATLTGTFAAAGKVLRLTSWIAATENLLLIELESNAGALSGKVSFRFPDELGLGVTKNDYWNYDQGGEPRVNHLPIQERFWSDGLLRAQRTYQVNTDQPTRLAMAARFLDLPGAESTGTEGNTFELKPGKKKLFLVALRSWFKASTPLEAASDRVCQLDFAELANLRERHNEWWSQYWNRSTVEINEPSIERQYYRSHYSMGIFSRDPDFPPCDYGICTSDDPVCAADYKINYNYQAGLLGLNVAGRFQQTNPYEAPGLAHLPKAVVDAKRHLGRPGAYMSLGLGPKGTVAEHIWLGQKSQNAFYLVNVAERWYLTRDTDYARRVYPLVREVTRFWEADLRYDKDRYVVVDDAAQEDSDHRCINSCSGIALVRLTMRLILDMSAELGFDAHCHEKWRHLSETLSPIPVRDAATLQSVLDSPGLSIQDVFPKGTLTGKPVIVLEEEGVDWSFGCSVQTIPIYPAGEIGLDSPAGLLKAATNTIWLRSLAESEGKSWPAPHPASIGEGAWFDANHGCLFFTAAVRAGYDPEIIWENLREWSENRVWGNGLRKGINDGIENYSTVPNAIHEMMLLSHENVLRFFRVWPRQIAPNARFSSLWAYGGFCVSAALRAGEVAFVAIESKKGRDCTFENPWPGWPVKITRTGGVTERLRGNRKTLKTYSGEKILLERA